MDEIPPEALYYLPNKIINCLVHVFNLSLSQGKFITSFKRAKVIPIYKKKTKSDMNNYRPISLLPVVSKILEKIMHKRVYSFLDRNEFFFHNQFGFRAKHSTELATSLLIDRVCNALNKNMKAMTIFLDMSKAFDCVDLNLLMQKLHNYGIRGQAYSWFYSYLHGRSQKVMVNGKFSENTCNIECGVPQGSILGPLLYLIYLMTYMLV